MTIIRHLIQDTAYSLRTLSRNLVFSAVAIATLALGIGATTAIFSVVNAVLLQPLPYPDAHELVRVVRKAPRGLGLSQTQRDFVFLRENSTSFETLAASGVSSGLNLAVGSSAEYVRNLPVSSGYFEMLESPPAQGRGFNRDEELMSGPDSVILGYDLWQRIFRGDASIVGGSVLLGGETHTVVGIAQEGFGSVPGTDIFTPMKVDDPQGGGTNYLVVGRLREDASLAAADEELASVSQGYEGLRDQHRFGAIDYQSSLTSSQRPVLLLLQGAVLLLLLIACANTAGLQLARNSTRRREMAIRAALGGGRGRLVRQMLAESVLLALAGGLLGLAIARYGSQALVNVGLRGFGAWNVGIDAAVLAAAAAVSLLTGLLFGLMPALQSSRTDVASDLRQGDTRSAGVQAAWPRKVLVVAEVALCMVLLVGAGLLIRTYVNLSVVDLGFDADNVLTAQMSLKGSDYSDSRRALSFYRRALERIERLPGVESTAVSNNMPVERGLNLPIRVPGKEEGADDSVDSVFWRYVTEGYFQTLRIPLKRGRRFNENDREASEPVALVNEAFVRKYFPQGRAIGNTIQLHPFAPDLDDPPRRIVGVVGNVKDWGLASPPNPILYVPMAQISDAVFKIANRYWPSHWLIRTAPSAGPPPERIAQAVQAVDPLQPFSRFRSMHEVISGSLSPTRHRTVLLGAFASIALAMAISGIYGLIAFTVNQRKREIGIRMALGATWQRVLKNILGQGVALAAAGAAIGLLASLALARFMQQQVFGVTTRDPATFAGVILVLILVSGAASLVPALRTLRADPVRSLREE